MSGKLKTSEQPCRKHKKSRPTGTAFNLKPGNVLLSHGEAPHYHRRRTISLLSSGWVQVVLALYGHQVNLSTETLSVNYPK